MPARRTRTNTASPAAAASSVDIRISRSVRIDLRPARVVRHVEHPYPATGQVACMPFVVHARLVEMSGLAVHDHGDGRRLLEVTLDGTGGSRGIDPLGRMVGHIG